MKTIFTRLLAGSLIIATILTACSKNSSIGELNNGPQQTTAANRVGVGNYPGGEAQVWNDLLAQTGTWSMADANSTITMSYPTNILTQLVFLNREWTVGDGQPQRGIIVLTAADGDELHLISKMQ